MKRMVCMLVVLFSMGVTIAQTPEEAIRGCFASNDQMLKEFAKLPALAEAKLVSVKKEGKDQEYIAKWRKQLASGITVEHRLDFRREPCKEHKGKHFSYDVVEFWPTYGVPGLKS